jgi:hypothetical protein
VIWEIVQRWATCRDALLPAIEMLDGTHTEDDILAGLISGRMLLWVSGRSGVVTEVAAFPRVKCLNIFLAGGKMADVMALREAITTYARGLGCKRITMLAARRGWERFFARESKNSGSYLWKEL